MVKYINGLFGTRYWYSVRFYYKNKQGVRIFDFSTEIGLKSKDSILNKRELKKMYAPFHKLNFIPKKLLQNGIIGVDIICYLGWFKQKTK